mmetsp:Transcript_4606/g.14089  ORF Transcript_4606/g.14089 Transcript_4606/m.14089 type:complete len:520 (-) Transcript_4606:68-1627(-)
MPHMLHLFCRPKRRLPVCAAIAVTVFCFNVFLLLWSADPPLRGVRLPLSLNERLLRRWEERLRNEEILWLRRFHGDGSNTADKYVAFFESGFQASVKIALEDNPIHFHLLDWTHLPIRPTCPSITLSNFELRHMHVRGHHQYMVQGWAELLGYYVDHILGFARKPPTTGRMISSRLFRHGHSIQHFLIWLGSRLLPSYSVPVCLQLWLDGIEPTPVAPEDARLLSFDTPPSLPGPEQIIDERKIPWLKHVVDSLVHAQVALDSDRSIQKNWMGVKLGPFLNWDSGMAFYRGPVCNAHTQHLVSGLPDSPGRICRFNRATIHRLVELDSIPATSKSQLHRDQTLARLKRTTPRRAAGAKAEQVDPRPTATSHTFPPQSTDTAVLDPLLLSDRLRKTLEPGSTAATTLAAQRSPVRTPLTSYLDETSSANQTVTFGLRVVSAELLEAWESALQGEPLAPITHLARYAAITGSRRGSSHEYSGEIFTFETDLFLAGISFRIHEVLLHVDQCLRDYGEGEVFL